MKSLRTTQIILNNSNPTFTPLIYDNDPIHICTGLCVWAQDKYYDDLLFILQRTNRS